MVGRECPQCFIEKFVSLVLVGLSFRSRVVRLLVLAHGVAASAVASEAARAQVAAADPSQPLTAQGFPTAEAVEDAGDGAGVEVEVRDIVGDELGGVRS